MADEAVQRVPSSVFRVTYAGIAEAVDVTVLGRVIGRYIPAISRPGQESEARGETRALEDAPGRPEAPESGVSPAPLSPSGAETRSPRRGSVTGMSQAQKDEVLRRVATK